VKVKQVVGRAGHLFDFHHSAAARNVPGGTAPDAVRDQLKSAKAQL
jgi:hypothetical protein